MSKTIEELRKDLTKAVQDGLVEEAIRIADLMRLESTRGASSVYLINVSANTPTVSTNYGHYWIKGRGKEEYGVTEIKSVTHKMDIGDDKKIAVPLSAEEIGRDITRMANSDIGEGVSFAGIFLSYTPIPAESDITENRARYLEQCKQWAVMGDNIWAQAHNYTHIADYMRRAVKELKLEKEWAYDPQEMNDCPGCGQKVSPKAAVCAHCFAVLDEKKARQYYPDRFPTRQAGRKTEQPLA